MTPRGAVRAQRVALAVVTAALFLAPLTARADCPAIRVILTGTVIEERLDLPLRNFPIAVRMEAKGEDGLPTLTWEAVVTDVDGRFRWEREFPAEPCHEGVFGKLRGAIWSWTVKARSRAYHHGAEGLAMRITLNTGPRLIPIERAEMLDRLDEKSHTVEIDIDVTL
ncbi:MAG: hypothetical protein Q8R92_07185 [Deltaproteobacteria bacterium]|nr:hypothetical protein [Deltaproteobacteria bacterium]